MWRALRMSHDVLPWAGRNMGVSTHTLEGKLMGVAFGLESHCHYIKTIMVRWLNARSKFRVHSRAF